MITTACLAAGASGCSRDCEARVERFTEDLEAIAEAHLITRPPPMIPASIDPIEVGLSGGPPPGMSGFVLTIERDQTAYVRASLLGDPHDGERIDASEDLSGRLKEIITEERKAFEDAGVADSTPDVLYIWADRSLSADALGEVATAVPAGLEVKVLAKTPRAVSKQRERDLQKAKSVAEFVATLEEVRAAGRGESMSHMADAMSNAIGRCSELREAAGDSHVGTMRAANLARAIAPALERCRCRVGDLDLFEYLIFSLLSGFENPVVVLSLPEAEKRLAASL